MPTASVVAQLRNTLVNFLYQSGNDSLTLSHIFGRGGNLVGDTEIFIFRAELLQFRLDSLQSVLQFGATLPRLVTLNPDSLIAFGQDADLALQTC